MAGDDGGSPRHQAIECGDDRGFAVGLDAARGFIEKQNGRIRQEGPGDA